MQKRVLANITASKLIQLYIAFLVITVFLFQTLAVLAQDYIYPKPSLSPEDVVAIQLEALSSIRENNQSGFVQTWIFAHPANKKMTGPLPRFASMLLTSNYAILIGHKSYRLENLYEKEHQSFIFVHILDENNKAIALFRWELAQSLTENSEKVWMTTNVQRLLKQDDVT